VEGSGRGLLEALSQLIILSFTEPNLLGDHIGTINRNTETSIGASKVVGLEMNVDGITCMLLSHHQNAGQNRDIIVGNRLSEIVSQFKYFGTTVTNQNLLQEEIKRTWNSDMLATIQSRTFCLLVCCRKT
jgi:hypothetical protein